MHNDATVIYKKTFKTIVILDIQCFPTPPSWTQLMCQMPLIFFFIIIINFYFWRHHAVGSSMVPTVNIVPIYMCHRVNRFYLDFFFKF